MPHLPSERLAELVDEAPLPVEREHLATCLSCTRELEAHRRLVAMASDERFRIAPPLTSWPAVSAGLREAGLVTPATTVPAPRTSNVLRLARRAAAALVLVGSGALLGRLSAGGALGNPAFSRPSDGVPASLGGYGGASVSLVGGQEGYASPEAAFESMMRAQREYEAAAMFLTSRDTATSDGAIDQYRTRLAALDRTAETMQEALRDAPEDPLINQYYSATLNAREQTLRRLGTTLPVGSRLGRF